MAETDCEAGIGGRGCGPLWRAGGSSGSLYAAVNVSSAPFVKVTFSDGEGGELTVGNESYPTNGNTAAIKSFEYSISNGNQCKIEIIDEHGGSFNKFFSEVLKCIDSAKYVMQVEFGWIFRDCNNNVYKWPTQCKAGGQTVDAKLQFLLIDIDVTFSKGVIKYTCTGTDLMQPIFNTRNVDVIKEGTRLKQAIIKLFARDPEIKVKFKRAAGGEWGFPALPGPEGSDPSDGVAFHWPSDNQNRLATANRWIQPFRTDKDLGITSTWDICEDKPTITFWEDPTVPCDENGVSMPPCVGTFIVNGGKCSSVLEFSPKYNWVQGFGQLNVGGASGQGVTAENVVVQNKPGPRCAAVQKGSKSDLEKWAESAGLATHVPAMDAAVKAWDKKALEYALGSQLAHRKANGPWEAIKPIQAELRIVGNPSPEFVSNPDMIAKCVAILVVNPFHIEKQGDEDCGQYLVSGGSLLNQILSNRNWMIQGAHHSIKEGNYTTTLKVFLATPGIDLPANAPLGGLEGGLQALGDAMEARMAGLDASLGEVC